MTAPKYRPRQAPKTLKAREWLSVQQVAEHLGVSNMTIYRVIDDGDLLAYRIGRSLRIDAADVERYLRGAVVGGAA
jgi:excisionase family DNA binding protein